MTQKYTPIDSSALPSIRDTIMQFGLMAKKSLGQNFLSDLNITRKIVKQAQNLDEAVIVEIGPGPGGLTRAIMESRAKKIVLIEKDDRCIKALEQLAAIDNRIEIRNEDALKVNWAELAAHYGQKIHIMANLPYNISTILLIDWLRHSPHIAEMILMFQREVADRITALPHSKAYGRLSVMTQWKMQATQMFHLPPNVFWPPPKIESTIVHFSPKDEQADAPQFEAMEKTVKIAFEHRRKMIRANMKVFGIDETALNAIGIDPQKRAEDLSLQDFLNLTNLAFKAK